LHLLCGQCTENTAPRGFGEKQNVVVKQNGPRLGNLFKVTCLGVVVAMPVCSDWGPAATPVSLPTTRFNIVKNWVFANMWLFDVGRLT